MKFFKILRHVIGLFTARFFQRLFVHVKKKPSASHYFSAFANITTIIDQNYPFFFPPSFYRSEWLFGYLLVGASNNQIRRFDKRFSESHFTSFSLWLCVWMGGCVQAAICGFQFDLICVVSFNSQKLQCMTYFRTNEEDLNLTRWLPSVQNLSISQEILGLFF